MGTERAQLEQAYLSNGPIPHLNSRRLEFQCRLEKSTDRVQISTCSRITPDNAAQNEAAGNASSSGKAQDKKLQERTSTLQDTRIRYWNVSWDWTVSDAFFGTLAGSSLALSDASSYEDFPIV